jgi:transcriptional regulator with XRE-family HTH domain
MERVISLARRLFRAEFASQIGTSTSRLSTYATGKVTPSAALMLRMSRVAGEITAERECPSANALAKGA